MEVISVFIPDMCWYIYRPHSTHTYFYDNETSTEWELIHTPNTKGLMYNLDCKRRGKSKEYVGKGIFEVAVLLRGSRSRRGTSNMWQLTITRPPIPNVTTFGVPVSHQPLVTVLDLQTYNHQHEMRTMLQLLGGDLGSRSKFSVAERAKHETFISPLVEERERARRRLSPSLSCAACHWGNEPSASQSLNSPKWRVSCYTYRSARLQWHHWDKRKVSLYVSVTNQRFLPYGDQNFDPKTVTVK